MAVGRSLQSLAIQSESSLWRKIDSENPCYWDEQNVLFDKDCQRYGDRVLFVHVIGESCCCCRRKRLSVPKGIDTEYQVAKIFLCNGRILPMGGGS